MDDPEPDPNTLIFILVFAVSTLICMLVTMGTSALRDVSEKKIHDLAEDGDKTAKKLSNLIDRQPKPADTMSVYTALCSMFAVGSAILWLLPKYAKFGLLPEFYTDAKAWLLNVIVPTFVILLASGTIFAIIGTLVPRRIGKQNADSVAFKMAGALGFLKMLILPVSFITTSIARILVKVFGGDPHLDEAPVTEDEILSILDEGEETGVLEEIEKEMINNIFEFGDLTAGEVMTHRTYLTAAEVNDDLNGVIEKAIDAGCSRIPVYEDELDNIKGVLYVKDLLKYIGNEMPKNLKPSDIMREAMFIPESKKCRDLFEEMTEKHLQMVIVSDEYGGVAGIVTVEDLIESIVGNIQDEFDDEEEEIEQISEDIFNIDGTSAIDEVAELLDVEFPEGEYDTIAGYIMSVLGRIPDPDEHPTIEFDGFSFTVEEMDERRIVRVLVERLPEIDEENQEASEENED